MTEKEFDFSVNTWQEIDLPNNAIIDIKTTKMIPSTVDVMMNPYLFSAFDLRVLASKLLHLADRLDQIDKENNQNV